MQPKDLQTHVTWYKGPTLFNGVPGVLKLDGDEIIFISSDDNESFKMSVNEVKEFNVIGTTSANYTRFSIHGALFGVKGAQWYIIPREKIDTQLSFIRSVDSKGDASYKDWQTALADLGVSAYSDKKSSLLIIALCFIPAVILLILWSIANSR